MSTSTLETGRGWQSGTSSWVFFAAMMPAMRAAPSTSPFLASPLRTISSVEGCITTRPSATATRSVTALADTSTMRASPLEPRWVSFGARGIGLSGRCGAQCAGWGKEGAGRRCDVRLAHEAFANQQRADADPREPRHVGWGEDAAFSDDHAVSRDQAGET